jgi:hypothetical protein
MPLTEDQREWIKEISGVSADGWAEREKARAEVLAGVRTETLEVKYEVRELIKFTVKSGKKEIASLLTDQSDRWEADEELDTVHDTRELTEALERDVMRRAITAKDRLNALSKRLETAEYNGSPLFTAKEIREEYWKPLVREGICPDNLVDDIYNETVQVFRGANEYYQERAQAEQDKYAESKTGTAKFFIDRATTVIISINDACGGPSLLSNVADATNTFAQATLTIVEGVIEKDAGTIVDAVGDMLEQALATAGVDKSLANMINAGYKASTKGAIVGQKFAAGDPKGAFQEMAKAIESAFEFADQGKDGQLSELGHYLSIGLSSAVDAGTAIKCLKQNPPDLAGLLEVAKNASQRAFQEGMGHYIDSQDFDEDEKEELEKAIEGISDDDLEGGFEAVKKLDPLRLDPEAIQAAKEQMALKQDEAIKEELERELSPDNKDFTNELDDLLAQASMDPKDREALGEEKKFQNSIEKMIAKIEKTRAALKIAEAIFDTGMKTAAEFFEPLQMASAGKDFVKNLIIAAKKAVELNQWCDQVENALKGASVYAAAFANRVKNLRIQISERTIHAIFDLMKVIGGGLSVAGAAGFGAGALAGVIVSKAASAGQAMADMSFKLREMADARLQWSKYRKCIELGDQTDRKLMREVLRGNPTLSKYAMAYGAIIENDPIAKMGMRVCGLSEENLEDEGTNVQLVVRYLETKFNDDPKLIKALADSKWEPVGTGLPTLANWKTNLASAVTDAGLLPAGVSALEGLYGVYEVDRLKFTDALEQFETAEKYFSEGRSEYQFQMRGFVTLKENFKKESERFKDSLEAFAKMAKEAEDDEEEKQKDVDFKNDFRATIHSLLKQHAARRKYVENAKKNSLAYKNSIRDMVTNRINPFLAKLNPFLEVQGQYVVAIDRLAKALGKFEPKNEAGQPILAVRDYIDGVRSSLEELVQEAKSKHPDARKEKEYLEKLKSESTERIEEIEKTYGEMEQELKKGLPKEEAELKELLKEWALTPEQEPKKEKSK